jgi:cytochrome P450 family 20 subfamily A
MAVMYLGIAVVLCVILLALLFRRKKPALIGYPRTDMELGNFVEMVKQGGMRQFLLNSHKRFGPAFEFWLGKRHAVSIASLEMFKAVKHLADRPFEAFESLTPLVGTKSIFFTNGAEYTRRRRLLHSPFFNVASVYQNLVPRLNEQIADDVLPFFEAAASRGQPTQMDQVSLSFTMKAIAHLIGSQAEQADVDTIIECQNAVFESLYAPLFGKALTKEDVAELDLKLLRMKAVMKKMITEGQATERPTLLKVYANESEEVVLDDMMSFLVGGFHTTNYLIQFALYLAAKYPEEQEKLYRELSNIEGSTKAETLPALRNYIDETLRWAGISTIAARESGDSEIVLPGGFVVSKGSFVLLPIEQMQHEEAVWDRPHEFIPDRFNDPESRGFKFVGFGFAGGRVCPGKSVALTEAKIFIAEVFRRFVVSLPTPDYSMEKNFVFIIRPEVPIELLISRR